MIEAFIVIFEIAVTILLAFILYYISIIRKQIEETGCMLLNTLHDQERIIGYKAVTKPQEKPVSKPSKTVQIGNGVSKAPELTRFEDMPFEEGYKILEEYGK